MIQKGNVIMTHKWKVRSIVLTRVLISNKNFMTEQSNFLGDPARNYGTRANVAPPMNEGSKVNGITSQPARSKVAILAVPY